MNIIVSPPNSIRGELITPSDKSISHRSAIFNSISKGISNIKNFSDGDDSQYFSSKMNLKDP